jgi:hypothetical protein|tara:strand:- start:783 stop:1232 length:450 start_codon:yes stop_codon:yes gene_type:complete
MLSEVIIDILRQKSLIPLYYMKSVHFDLNLTKYKYHTISTHRARVRREHARRVYARSENDLRRQFFRVILKSTIMKTGIPIDIARIEQISFDIIIGKKYPQVKRVKLPEDGATKIKSLRVISQDWILENGVPREYKNKIMLSGLTLFRL